MANNNQQKSSLSQFRRLLNIVAILVFTTQLFIDPSQDNFVANLISLTTFLIGCLTLLRPQLFFGSGFTGTIAFIIITANSLAPMIGTLLDGHSLVYTLLSPVTTYCHRSIVAGTLIVAHTLSKSHRYSPLRKVMADLGDALETKIQLPANAIWVLGGIGLLALSMKYLVQSEALIKLLDGFKFLGLAPFILLLAPYSQKLSPLHKYFLIGYYLLQIGIGLALNSRGGMSGPVILIVLGWLITLLLGYINVNASLMRRAVLLGIIGLFMIGQFTDFSTAIIMERGDRADRSLNEQLFATLDRFQDKKELEDFRREMVLLDQGVKATEIWQENYIQNPFLARFIQVKFDDNCFDRILHFSQSDLTDLQDVTIDKLIVQLPDPLIGLLNISVNKKELNSYSIGDKIDVLSGRGFLGGFLTGSLPAHLYAVLGWLYPFLLFGTYYVLFGIFHGLFSTPISVMSMNQKFPTYMYLIISSIYIDMSIDGVSVLSLLFRNIWQSLILYFLVVKSLRLMRLIPIIKANHFIPVSSKISNSAHTSLPHE